MIAYFSHTGNTEKVAQEIADYTGGDLAEIRRTEEYENLYEEAETEILEGAHPDITVSVDGTDITVPAILFDGHYYLTVDGMNALLGTNATIQEKAA